MTKSRYKYIKERRRADEAIVAAPLSTLSSDKRGDMLDKLSRYRDMYNRLDTFRRNCQRNIDYTFGKQWGDKIRVDGEWITEEENILRQGKVPLKNNMIRQLVKSVTGLFRSNHTEPEAISRDRDEQRSGEVMTCSLQYAYQNNDLWELDSRMFEMFLITGLACQCVGYRWIKSRHCYDVFVNNVNYSRLFFNGDIEDPRGTDIQTIGVLMDLPLEDIITQFAKTHDEADRIREIYSSAYAPMAKQNTIGLNDERYRDMTFSTPYESGKCRMIQVWELESKPRIQVHDPYEGDYFMMELEDIAQVEAENERRRDEALANGLSTSDVEEQVLLKYKWFNHQFWTVRYLTPYGDILFESECPYWHNEHPFTLKVYPLVNGEAHSFVEDVIDQQRYINRMITLIDFIMGASAKGVLVFPEDALGDMTKEEVLDEWVKYNGVIFAKVKAGMPMPQQISTNATNVGAADLLQIQMGLLKEISGVSGAMMGQKAASGTPSSLYAQQTQNSQSNLMDILESFSHFRNQRDYKMMQVIQQFYDEPRYSNIAGRKYKEEDKWYTPEKCQNTRFDLVIHEANLTPAYRAMMNQFLLQIFQMGQMNVKTLLKLSSYPFADNIIEEMEAQEQAMQQQQMAQQAAAQQQVSPMGGTPAANIGMPTDQTQALSGAGDPNAQAMIQQALMGA